MGGHLRQRVSGQAQADGQARAGRDGAGCGRLELDGLAGPGGCPRDLGDRRARHRLQPDALPDAGGARVPDVVGLGPPVLLAARLTGVQRPVLGPHHQQVPVGAPPVHGQSVRDVDDDRGVPAVVLGDALAVHPHRGAVVDRPQMQQHPIALDPGAGGLQVQGAQAPGVPHHRVVPRPAHARAGALGREGHGDRPPAHPALGPPLLETRVGVVVGEVPGAVQGAPAGAAQLGEGVAAGRVGRRPGPCPVGRVRATRPRRGAGGRRRIRGSRSGHGRPFVLRPAVLAPRRSRMRGPLRRPSRRAVVGGLGSTRTTLSSIASSAASASEPAGRGGAHGRVPRRVEEGEAAVLTRLTEVGRTVNNR